MKVRERKPDRYDVTYFMAILQASCIDRQAKRPYRTVLAARLCGPAQDPGEI